MDLSRFDAIIRTGADQLATDPYCDQRPVVLMNLSESYGEKLQEAYQPRAGSDVEISASDQFGTWTAIYTRADGIACVVTSGVGWTAGFAPDLSVQGGAA